MNIFFKQTMSNTNKVSAYSLIIFSLILQSHLSLSQTNETSWDYREFSKVTDAVGKPLFILEYGTNSKGYDGYVKWRVTNYTTKPVYDVTLNKRTYTLRDNRKVIRGEEELGLNNVLNPGKSLTNIPDPVNTEESKGFSNVVNNNPVTHTMIEEPVIKFKMQRGENKIGWRSFGERSYEQTGNNEMYLAKIRQGDEALQKEKYDEAKSHYLEAKKLKPGVEIENKLSKLENAKVKNSNESQTKAISTQI